MSPARLCLIDADSILYATATSAEMCAKGQGTHGQDLWFPVRHARECYEEVLSRFDERIEQTEAESCVVVLSGNRNFRYDILPTYKSNRARTRRPPMLVELREMLLASKPFPMLVIEGIEADDTCGITSTSMQVARLKGKPGPVPVISSDDKDMLSIPGLLHIPRKGSLVEVPVEEADRAHLFQTLVGDAVDGYTGIPGVGVEKAARILDDNDGTPAEMWKSVLAAYLSRGLTEEDALTQARVARILRNTD